MGNFVKNWRKFGKKNYTNDFPQFMKYEINVKLYWYVCPIMWTIENNVIDNIYFKWKPDYNQYEMDYTMIMDCHCNA